MSLQDCRMSILPHIPHHEVTPPRGLIARAEQLAEDLRTVDPSLRPSDAVTRLAVDQLEDGPTLHLDDQSSIALLDRIQSSVFQQDRARLRAGTGDFVASCAAPVASFETYCESRLNLGAVSWLHPQPLVNPMRVAAACWTDPRVRRTLVRALRAGELRYLHPGMGSAMIWAVAELLQRASGSKFSVIAPPPVLCARVNDKAWFADVVGRLFGPRAVPRTLQVSNFASLAFAVKSLLPGSHSLVVKIPDSAGGCGNLVLHPDEVASDTIGGIRRRLKERLADLPWQPGERLLVGTWETCVLAAPSSQLWIPPEASGAPVVEGVFEQHCESARGEFMGTRPAQLPGEVTAELVERSWLLARLFQRLGYVGRCSFDAILVDDPSCDTGPSRLEFIECNGRWGGTSTPMNLVDRLLGGRRNTPYAAEKCSVPGLDCVQFSDVLDLFQDDLFDARSGSGCLVFFGPNRLQATSSIDVIAFGESWAEVQRRARVEVPARLAALVSRTPASRTNDIRDDYHPGMQ